MDSLPPAYEIAVTQATPVAEERRSTSTDIENERPPPIAQSNAPIKDQPVRMEYRHPLDHIRNDPSINTSNQTLSGSNTAHSRATRPAQAPQEREEEGEHLAQSDARIRAQPDRIDNRHPLDPSRNYSNQAPSNSNAAYIRAAQPAAAPQEREEGGPVGQSNELIRVQPDRIDNRHPLDTSRNHSNQALSGNNAPRVRAAQPVPAPHEREEEGGLMVTVGRTETRRSEERTQQTKQKECGVNIFCCCSGSGACPG